MTREETLLEIEVMNSKDPEWFCPLINKTCNKKCICYQRAHVWPPIEPANFDIIPSQCTNAMFFEKEINIQY